MGRYAAEQLIGLVHDSVEALVADPEGDAVYVSTTNERDHGPGSTSRARSRWRSL